MGLDSLITRVVGGGVEATRFIVASGRRQLVRNLCFSRGVMAINTDLEQTFVCVFGCLFRGISVQHSPQFLVTRISYRGAGICPILEKLSRLDCIAM